MTKLRKRCNMTKGASLFTKDNGAKDGLSIYCKDCHNMNKQQGCCKDCGTGFSILPVQYHIDHCHSTGVIRDLLCNACNIKRGA